MFDYVTHPRMPDRLRVGAPGRWASGAGEPASAESRESEIQWLRSILSGLGDIDGRKLDDSGRLEVLERLERLKSAAAAAQARVTVAFKASQIGKQRTAGVPAQQLGRGVGAQVALARRDSPYKAARLVGLAEALVHEMPGTLAALGRGDISEWRATLMVRETACLSSEHRTAVDTELSGRLAELGDRRTAAEARRGAYRLDPHAATRRAAAAAADRRVSLRPAPDVMSNLSALLPVAQGVAAFAALSRVADSARAAGDERTRGQVMADELVQRVTGQSSADGVPVDVQVVMTDRSVFAGDPEPADVPGFGPVPAPMARSWVRGDNAGSSGDPADVDGSRARSWLRRLYAAPTTGELVAMDSRQRCFPDSLRRFIVARDQVCRMPWCEAPIRHADHVVPFVNGGATSLDNGQGLCEACNHAKQAPGWGAVRDPDGTITVTTPSGKTYSSRQRSLPGHWRGTAPRGRSPT